MQNDKTKTLVTGGLMAAFICALTMFVRIPIPIAAMSGAYVNAGDAGVYLAAVVLGGWPGALAAALGSALADLLVGAALYCAPTFVIKGAMALLAARILYSRRRGTFAQALAFGAASLLMTAGYFAFECMAFGVAAALAGVPFNLVQAAGGIILGVIACQAAQRLRLSTNRP